MKLGVSSYSFKDAVHAGNLDYLDIPAKAAEIGFDTIEFSDFILPEGESTQGFAEKVARACEKAGLPVDNYTIGGDFLSGSDGDLSAEIKRLHGQVDVADILGSKGMRHDAAKGVPASYPNYYGFEDVLPRIADGCRGVTEYAESKGIRTMVENHGTFTQESLRVEQLVRAVAHENFGVLVDIGNFLCADDDPKMAVGRLAPFAFHAHAKDFHIKSGNGMDPGTGWIMSRGGGYLRGAVVGHGDVPVLQLIRSLAKAGYDGTLSLEFEGIEESIKGIEFGYATLRRYLELI